MGENYGGGAWVAEGGLCGIVHSRFSFALAGTSLPLHISFHLTSSSMALGSRSLFSSAPSSSDFSPMWLKHSYKGRRLQEQSELQERSYMS